MLMLEHLKKRFPEQQQNIEDLYIEDLYKENSDFRALCMDYEEAVKTLSFWRRLVRLPIRKIKREISDCREFMRELETEILMTLQEHNLPGSSDQKKKLS